MGRSRKRFLIALAVTAPTLGLLAFLAPTPGTVLCSVTNGTGHVLTSVYFEVEDRTVVIARIEPGETRSVRVTAEKVLCWYWTDDISDGFISSIGFSDAEGHTLGPVGLILPRSGRAQLRVQPRGGTADRPANYDVVGVISSRLRPTDIWDASRRGAMPCRRRAVFHAVLDGHDECDGP
jgi:hypothetical protein